MNTTFVVLLFLGTLLGLAQLLLGIFIGRLLSRASSTSGHKTLARAQKLTGNLQVLTHHVEQAVSRHRSQCEEVEAQLAEDEGDHNQLSTDLVVQVVAEVLKANRQLQHELMEAEQQLAEQAAEIEATLSTARTDPLTDLPNRRVLDEELEKCLQEYHKKGTPFSLLMVDLDYFKKINDQYGHPLGDQVICSTAQMLRKVLRRNDCVTRYGGEEFAIILPGATLQAAHRAAEKVEEGIRQVAQEFPQLEQPITSSNGAASIMVAEDGLTLIGRADAALYAAKQHGRNQTYYHDGTSCLSYQQLLARGQNDVPSLQPPETEQEPATPQEPAEPPKATATSCPNASCESAGESPAKDLAFETPIAETTPSVTANADRLAEKLTATCSEELLEVCGDLRAALLAMNEQAESQGLVNQPGRPDQPEA